MESLAAKMKFFSTSSLLLAICISLQGCDVPRVEGYASFTDMRIPTHSQPKWRTKPNYWHEYSFQEPMTKVDAFNSCMDPQIDSEKVCNGRGTCEPFIRTDVVNPVYFCRCQPDWGDPECGTMRKRQSVAWLYAMLFGYLGLDRLYLGWYVQAFSKLAWAFAGFLVSSVMGFPFVGTGMILVWWLWDVVRIGSSDVHAYSFRVNSDLPHWAFAIFTLVFFGMIGFILGASTVYWEIIERRRKRDQVQVPLNYGAMSTFHGFPDKITL
jgi:TM2 domain-containing membrane protein YozV